MEDKTTPAALPDLPEAINIAAGIKGFILWIGGSLAGITALLYACGYLVTRAHLHMLGLYGFVEFNSDHFLQEGAKFFLEVAYDLAEVSLLFFTMIGIVLVPVVIGSLIGKRRVLPLLERFSAWRELRRSTQAPRIARSLFYGVLFAVLIWLTGESLHPSYAPLCISDLLYSDAGSNECIADGVPYALSLALQKALRTGDSVTLGSAFGERLTQAIYLVILTCVAWYTVARWRWRNWLISPFVVSMGLFLLLLPMDYGVLKRPTVYPVLSITASDDAGLDAAPTPGSTLYLLDKTDSEFIAWDATARKVIWMPSSTLSRAEIVRMHDLFGAPTKTAPATGAKK
ncbi:hypothetical protein MNR01_04760 [Lysobacter sp. S4-A87]|uniref:hypothetical protein n=1 Tax=Lysobacter sp. S4-A87 TaxID=2925843 RepID=UPI001F53C50A|nr:hypothetical protein [Lysobacter sp. S4-A87]UNK50345.1 hypothetical protein MNR01_04760 [Lysobacter sp. S4-A87]